MIGEPANYKQAVASPQKSLWLRAVEAEVKSQIDTEAWKKVYPVAGKKVVGCRWVYKIRWGPDGTPVRYKARLVIQGHQQVEGVDYFQTYAPVARLSSIRTLFAVAAAQGLTLRNTDVDTAFLQAPVEEEIYMRQPEGYDDGTGRVLRLLRALYGLKQAPRAWYGVIHQWLINQGFKSADADPCVYVKTCVSGDRLIVALYVGDPNEAPGVFNM